MSVINYFIQPFANWYRTEFFRRVLYIFLLLNTVSLLPVAYEIFAYEGIIGTRGWNFNVPTLEQGSYAFINVLSHPANLKYPWLYQAFIGGQILFLITGILRILPKVSSVMIYFFTVNLFLKGFLMFTGAEVLIHIMLFYLIFIQRVEIKPWWKPEWKLSSQLTADFSPLQNILNNTFFMIVLIQVCVLYFFSTFYKLLDPNWLSGEAVMLISRVDAFSSSTMEWIFADSPVLSMIATYLVLIYQGSFMILVWIKRIKIPFLLFGVFFHLAIAFGMGIFTFGIAMCLVYIPFLENHQLKKLRTFFVWNKARKSVS